MNTTINRTWLRLGAAACLTVALGAGMVACSSSSSSSDAGSADSSSTSGTSSGTTSLLMDVPEDGTIDADDIDYYCGACHFDSIENASISSFNVDTVDAAMVESMLPNATDELIDALAEYFAAIPADESEE